MSDRRRNLLGIEFYPHYPRAIRFLKDLKKSAPAESLVQPILDGAIFYLERNYQNWNQDLSKAPWQAGKKKQK